MPVPERAAIDVDVDVAVTGGGPVGRPLALALGGLGLRVALVDREPAAGPRPVPESGGQSAGGAAREPERDPGTDARLDARCTALAGGTVDWLAARGLWHPDAALAAPIHRVRVSHRGRFGATRIDAAELGRRALGEVVDNAAFVASLDERLAAAVAAGSIVRLDGASVAAVRDAGPDALALELTGDARCVRTRLLVVADGAASTTRALLGIDVRRVDHDQVAVLGGVALEDDHGGVAHERFTDSGPLALLPRPGRTATYVMCIDPDERAASEAMDAPSWLDHLQVRFGRRAGRFVAAGARTCVPLVRIEARATRATRTLLLGNAARLLHPVAGQGYNLAVRDVAALVAALEGAPDPGDAALLERYERDRRGDRRRTVALTDALARTFRGRAALPGRLRAAGLAGLDLAGPARRAFARASAGL